MYELKAIKKVLIPGISNDGLVIPAGGQTGAVKRYSANAIIKVKNSIPKDTNVTDIATEPIILSPSLAFIAFRASASAIIKPSPILQFGIGNLFHQDSGYRIHAVRILLPVYL